MSARTGAEEKALVIALCEAMAGMPVVNTSFQSEDEEAGARAAFQTIADAVRDDVHVLLARAPVTPWGSA